MQTETVQITVKLFASFRAGRFVEAKQTCVPGTRIADIISRLEIAPKDIGMIMLDNRHAEPEQPLHAGARLSLFPLLGGG